MLLSLSLNLTLESLSYCENRLKNLAHIDTQRPVHAHRLLQRDWAVVVSYVPVHEGFQMLIERDLFV